MKKETLDKIIDFIREEAPTNNIGGGKIAGSVEAGDDPPVRKKLLLQCLESPLEMHHSMPILLLD